MFYADIPCGFAWGPVNVIRVTSDEKSGWVVLAIDTKKNHLELRITKTGHIRINEFYYSNWEDKEK